MSAGLHTNISTCWLFLKLNHQCMVKNNLKPYRINKFIPSFCNLPGDSSTDSSTSSSSKKGDLVLPLSMSTIPFFFNVIQLFTSSSSSFRHFYPPLCLSFNNVFQMAVPMQNVTNLVSLSSVYCV